MKTILTVTHRKLFSRLLSCCAATLVVACNTAPSQTTTVDRVLMAPNLASTPYRKVLVIGATPSREMARNIETALMQHLAAREVDAHSFVRESDSTEPTEAAVRALVDKTGVDGVIVVSGRLVGAALAKTDEQTDLEAKARGGGLFNYFRYDYKEKVARAGRADYTVNVVFVSDFFDVASKNRIYSVESSTAHGQTSYDIIMAESKAIVGRLRQDGIIR